MPRPTYLATELYDSLLETDSRNRADRAIQGLGWQSKLDDALDGLQQTYEREWKPAPVIVSDRPDAMAIRDRQQAVAMPNRSGPPETPGLPAFSADDFVHENGISAYRPAAPPSDASAIPGPELSPNGTPISVLRGAPAATTTQAMPTGGQIDNSSREAFVRTAYPHFLQAAGGNQGAAEMLLAAAISENGTIGTGRPILGNAFFGIKGQGTAGSFTSPTWESVNGQRVNITDNFAAYNDPVEGSRAFFTFLEDNPRYHGALARYRETGDASQLFRDVNAAGYATDPNWAATLENIRANQVAPAVRQVAGDQRQSLNAGAGVSSASSPGVHPAVAARWQQRVGSEMTPEDMEQLRMLGVLV